MGLQVPRHAGDRDAGTSVVLSFVHFLFPKHGLRGYFCDGARKGRDELMEVGSCVLAQITLDDRRRSAI